MTKTKKNNIINKIIVDLLNRGFTNDRVINFLNRMESLSNKEANKVIRKMRRLPKVMLERQQMNFEMVNWRRTSEFQEVFNPANKERYWIWTGGRGSGKSYEVGEDIVKMTFEKGIGILFCRYMAKSVKTSIAPSFLSAAKRLGLEEHFYITEDKVINKSTGSFIYMAGLHSSGSSTSGLKSLEGVNIVVMDEAEDIDSVKAWESFNKLDDSIRTLSKVNRICLVLNPKSRNGKVYQNFVENKSRFQSFGDYDVEISTRSDVRHIHTTFHSVVQYLDAGWLHKEKVARTRAEGGIDPDTGRILTEEEHQIAKEFYSNNYIGIFNNFIAGRIFPYYETQDQFPSHIEPHYGLDFGFSHVDALVKVGVCLRTRKIFIEKLIFENGLSESKLADRIKEVTPRGVKIICDSAEPRLINDLRRSTGRSLQPVKKQEVSMQIQQMHDFTIVVCGDSEEIENELNLYRWSEELDSKGKPKPNKKDDVDNSIDATRYALTVALGDYDRVGKVLTKPEEKTVEESETKVERKKRLFREALERKRNLS